jgi:hypothetical protein
MSRRCSPGAVTEHNRADGTSTVLRWLIGDDHVPVRTESPGELVDGFGHVVRSAPQITPLCSLAAEGLQRAAVRDRDLDADPDSRRLARQDADYLGDVAATLRGSSASDLRPRSPARKRASTIAPPVDATGQRPYDLTS